MLRMYHKKQFNFTSVWSATLQVQARTAREKRVGQPVIAGPEGGKTAWAMSELLQTAFTTFHKRPILLVTLRLLKKPQSGVGM